jgi:glycerate 2-kinase
VAERAKIKLHAGRPAGHNFPTVEGVAGTQQMMELLRNAGPKDVGICLISGGGSALLPLPVEGVSLEDKQLVTQLLHACGASIDELNTVRKKLSLLKGGGFARAFTGKKLISLILSDVIGDPLSIIASGPTVEDASTNADALAVLEKYDLISKAPASIREVLKQAPPVQDFPPNVENHILGNNQTALQAATRAARDHGYVVLNLGSFFAGDTQQCAKFHAGVVRSILYDAIPFTVPACILSGGETTVDLRGSIGKGGRNQEFVLTLLQELDQVDWMTLTALSGGSDGEDGPTDAAGAIADQDLFLDAKEAGLATSTYLKAHDAYRFFDQIGGLVKTGPTQTNVMDVRVLLIG